MGTWARDFLLIKGLQPHWCFLVSFFPSLCSCCFSLQFNFCPHCFWGFPGLRADPAQGNLPLPPQKTAQQQCRGAGAPWAALMLFQVGASPVPAPEQRQQQQQSRAGVVQQLRMRFRGTAGLLYHNSSYTPAGRWRDTHSSSPQQHQNHAGPCSHLL